MDIIVGIGQALSMVSGKGCGAASAGLQTRLAVSITKNEKSVYAHGGSSLKPFWKIWDHALMACGLIGSTMAATTLRIIAGGHLLHNNSVTDAATRT